MFPAGAPGLALIVLRLVTIAWLHLDATARFAFSPHVPALILLEVLSVALLVGFLTPYVTCALIVANVLVYFFWQQGGLSLGDPSSAHYICNLQDWAAIPNRITLFRLPLEADFADPDDLADEVWLTIVHELAHHLGIDDDRLHELGVD